LEANYPWQDKTVYVRAVAVRAVASVAPAGPSLSIRYRHLIRRAVLKYGRWVARSTPGNGAELGRRILYRHGRRKVAGTTRRVEAGSCYPMYQPCTQRVGAPRESTLYCHGTAPRFVIQAAAAQSPARRPPRAPQKQVCSWMPDTISVVLIESNVLVREAIAALIGQRPGFEVLLVSAETEAALRKLREAKPRAVLLDSKLKNHDSLRLMTAVHDEVPESPIVVMGLLPHQDDITDFVRAGACGFNMETRRWRKSSEPSVRSPRVATRCLVASLARCSTRSLGWH